MLNPEEEHRRVFNFSEPGDDKVRPSFWHDYSLPGIYMVTISAINQLPIFGQLVTAPEPYVRLSPFGAKVLSDEICKISMLHSNIKVLKTCMMPDHIHLIIEADKPFREKRHLGVVVHDIKSICTQEFRRLRHNDKAVIFAPNYRDGVILPDFKDGWERYIDGNARRLAIKQLYPEVFNSRYALTLGGRQCQIYGNMFLLDVPDKCAVVVHRSDTIDDFSRKRAQWLACGDRGGVIVTAAVAPRERMVFDEALARGYRIIQLCDNGFPPLYRPDSPLYDCCIEGRILQVSPWPYNPTHHKISRSQCLELNALAESIASNN